MEEALPVLIFMGIGMLALVLLLVGLFATARARARRASGELIEKTLAEGKSLVPKSLVNKPAIESQAAPQVALQTAPPAPSQAAPQAAPSLLPALLDQIVLCPESDGTFCVEIEGRRFRSLSEIGDEQLVNRVWAAVAGLQRFAGLAPRGPESAAVELEDELRTGRLPTDRALVIEFRKRRYRRLQEVRDAKTGRDLLAMIDELVKFTQGLVAPPPAPPPAQPAPPADVAFLDQLTKPAAAEPEPLKVYSLFDSLRTPTPKVAPMPVGIAGQIEQILQRQLLDNATLRGWSVHLVTAPDGSLAVQVEGQTLPWPDRVPPGPVRDAVQRAIWTWEQS